MSDTEFETEDRSIHSESSESETGNMAEARNVVRAIGLLGECGINTISFGAKTAFCTPISNPSSGTQQSATVDTVPWRKGCASYPVTSVTPPGMNAANYFSSPCTHKRTPNQSNEDAGEIVGRPLHPGFIGLDERIEQRYRDQEKKLANLRTQGQLLRAHSQFVREGAPVDHAARYAVQQHARTTGVKHTPGYGSARNVMSRDNSPRQPAGQVRRPAGQAPAGSAAAGVLVPSTTAPRPQSTSGELHQKCDVMNCEIEFSSLGKFIKHTQAHNHSPCHPTRHLMNGSLENDAPFYCCTTCGNLYDTADLCLTHMEETGHDHLQEPVPVPGFMCLQCFMVFPTSAACRLHQHQHQHFGYGYALPDDTGRPEPQFLPAPVYKLFRRACKKVASSVECLNCSLTLQDSESVHTHLAKDHNVMAMTEKSLADVWPTLMCRYTCVQCQRLYNKLPPEGLEALHQCSPTMSGIIVETDVTSTYDFILRRSLSHISLVAGMDDEPLNTAEEVFWEAAGRNEALEGNSRGAEGGAGNDDDTDSLIIEGDEEVAVLDNDSDNSFILLDDSIEITGVARPHTRERIDSIELLENEQHGGARPKDRGVPYVPPHSPRRSLSIEVIENPCTIVRRKALGEESDSDDDDRRPLRDAVREKSDTGALEKQQIMTTARNRDAERRSPQTAAASASNQAGRCNICTSTLWRNPKNPSKPPRCSCGGSAGLDDHTSPSSSNSSVASAKTPSPPGAVLVTIPGSSGKRKREVNIQQFANSQKKRKDSPITPDHSPAQNATKRISPRLKTKTTEITGRKETVPSNQTKPATDNRNIGSMPEYIPIGGTSKESNESQLRTGLRGKKNKPKRTPPKALNQMKKPANQSRPLVNNAQNVQATTSGATNTSKPKSSTPQNTPTGASNKPKSNPPSAPSTPKNSPANNQNRASNLPMNSPSRPPMVNLETMRYIIFVDFDNWMGFFQRLLQPLPDKVFVWGFYGGSGQWIPPRCPSYTEALRRRCFYLHPKCGQRKDAADMVICMNVGRMDEKLPTHIPFTILSGDKGFQEIERQFSSATRRVRVIDPHHQQVDELYTLLLSNMDA